MEQNRRICVFTGHRSINAKHMALLSEKLDEVVERLIAEGYTEFRAGGAVGFDTVAALAVLEKKKRHGQVRLHMFLPCYGQEKNWSENMKRTYRFVLERADRVRYSCENYVNGCMQMRNRDMVSGSEICVAYYDTKRHGGSRYTVEYAQKRGVSVINLFGSEE